MADEENKDQQEETQGKEPKAEEEPQAEEPKAEEVPAEESQAEAQDEPAEETPAEEPAAEGEAALAEAGADEMEGLDWKARRRLERSRRSGEPGPQQSPEERAAARREARKLAAKRRYSYRTKKRGKREPGTGTPPVERRSAGRKVRQGRVVSSKPDKTITVQIEIARRHPQYEKIVRRSRTLHAHDAQNEAGEGDLVRVVETRPLSRTKRWRLVEILEKAK
jgi:small subunit ribosomal protein S17